MATCFRLQNRFCCTNFFKPAYTLHSEKSTLSPRKPVQQLPSKAEINALNVGQIYRISATSQLCKFSDTIPKRSDCMPYFPIAPCSAVTEYRQTLMNPSMHRISQNENRLMASDSPVDSKTDDQASPGRPTEEQLQAVLDHLTRFLPSLFNCVIDPDKYHPNVILENRIRGTRSVGFNKYCSQLTLLKLVAHFKFACVRFFILKITKHPEDGTIRCRWRIAGVNGMSVIFQFWKYTPFNMADKIQNAPSWYDGFSTYYVGSDGRIYKHIIDKMMPDDDKVTIDKSFGAKVTLCLGLLPPGQREILASMVDSSADDSYLSQVMLPLEKIS